MNVLMIETYTQPTLSKEITGKPANDDVRLDVDDQLFFDMLKNELDVLLRQPKTGSIRKITSYSRSQRMPLV